MKPYYENADAGITLYHGDCLAILPELEAGSIDAVVTDPPWNCGYFGVDDETTWSEYKFILSGWLRACETICDGQIWFLSTKSIAYVSDLFSGYRPFASVKNFSQMMDSVLPNCWDIAFIRDTLRAYCGNGRNWFVANTAGMMKDRTDHPTPRTVDVMKYMINLFSWRVIVDPFMGSGTTGVACIRTGRRFIGIEIEEKYCEIAAKRIERELAQPRLPFMEKPERVPQKELFQTVA